MARRGAGEGSVFRRDSDGRWVARLVVEEGGRARRRTFYGKTRKEALEKLREAQRRVEDGGPVVDSSAPLSAFLVKWRATTLEAAELKPTTRENYATLCRRHLEPTLGHIALGKLTPADVEALVLAKRREGLSDATIRLIYTTLRRALDAAVRDGLVRRNVASAVSRPRVGHREAKVLTPLQAQQLLDAARGDRLFAFFAVAMGCGLRRGEGLALRWADVDLDEGLLRVGRTLSRTKDGLVFTEPKSARSRRTVPLPRQLVDELRRHRQRQLEERLLVASEWEDNDLVFPSRLGTPLDPRNALRAFQAAVTRAGLPMVGLHTLRHTCASLLLAQGVHPRVVMETLGHSGISITMDTYSHVMPQQQREAADHLAAALSW
ncbi:site-specific integrase [Kineococcus sp. SYSU DK005]|uniref:site-specific integrase n=1 Tax=Kineococcus sp. SYSU DK005 TaxID=3383126 RepID=UPI003D7D46BD